ncbi:Sjogren's syndrome/scleroderma autoantigen 1 family protein [Halococcus sp. IIIV-5B]|uniref:Sjogren's syndrome/scleroderma autoantigen 1 family protein n=1 Tax=Halococcus sp. IIIV-5B TaxID=2321230 RepID=UPI000E76D0A2|nr:Sjogren's syndrome/scleroderma autoantigen 1 family protein [Halococcus sp. IIIV-5B]RJT04091.1 hypothetical protein D3261_09970 [Halococcus sp. IIIV-5B]
MSEFDKEAERKKLEERFAEEEEDRETTERMSELLLQGATMTDTHCDECGNPLFRYDGQTFCSSCQRTVQEAGTAGHSTAEDATADAATEPADAPSPTAPTDQQPAGDPPHDGSTANGQRPQPPERTDPSRPAAAPAQGQNPPSAPVQTPDDPRTQNQTDTSQSTEATDGLAATEASLSRTLRQQAAAAERAEDLSRTRKHLAAAREAAEALDAVRSAR